MKEKTSITSVETLKLSDFYIKIDDGKLIITHIDENTSFTYNKDALVVSNTNDNKNTLTITNKDIKINQDGVIVGKEGNILDYIKWDEKNFILGDGIITIDESKEFYFNGIITDRNLSPELLDIIKFNKGEQGPTGPQGPAGEPGKDGTDSSKYTYVLYSKLNPNDEANAPIIGDAVKLGISRFPTKETMYMGVRYNMVDEQPTSLENEDFSRYEWMRYKGENAYTAHINGLNIFKIPKNTNGERALPTTIELNGIPSFPNVKTCYWEMFDFDTNSYLKISNSDNKRTIEISYSDYIEYYKEHPSLDIMFVVVPDDDLNQILVRDMTSIYALREGDDSNALTLSNQMHNLQTDENNVVLPKEYENAFTYIGFYTGVVQKTLKPSELSIRSLSGRTEWKMESVNASRSNSPIKEVKLSCTNLVDSSDILEITHIDTGLMSQFSLYKAGDGKVRLVRINGSTSVWKENEDFSPSILSLQSRGYGDIVFGRWEYKKPSFQDFNILDNANTADIVLNAFEFFHDCNQVVFKAVYINPISNLEVFDLHVVDVLDSMYNLTISNSQDKVALDTYNNYKYQDVTTDISLYQGNSLVPINVIEQSKLMSYSGGKRTVLGDIAIYSKHQSTKYRIEQKSGEDASKIKFVLEYCENGDFITFTHIESGQSKIFSILIDDKYNTSVDIVGEQIFYYNNNVYKPQSITLQSSGVHIPINETIQWSFLNESHEWVDIIGANSASYTIYPDERWLGFSADTAKFKVKYGSEPTNQDIHSVFKLRDGSDSKILVLSNESQSILTDEYGVIPKTNGVINQLVYTNIDMYSGNEHMDSSTSDYTSESVFVDCVGRFEQTEGNNKTVKLIITDLTADYGNVGVTRTVNGIRYTRTLFIYKSKQGISGIAGDWVSYIFFNSNTKPTRPLGDSGLLPVPENSGWLDAPIGGGSWWMSKAKIGGSTNLTVEPFSEPILVSGRDGLDGIGSYILDLDNQNVSVFCDKNGTIIGTLPKCKATLYFGSEEAQGVVYSIYPQMEGVGINDKTGEIVITSLKEDYNEIPVRADVGLFSATHYMTVTKVYKGKDAAIVSLIPSTSLIRKDADLNIEPKTISCDLFLNIGGEESYVISNNTQFAEQSAYLDGYTLERSINDNAFEPCSLSGESNGVYALQQSDTKISYRLVYNSKVSDIEDIYVIQDGTIFMYHYMLGDKTPPSPNDNSWSTQIPALLPNKFIWMRASKIVNGSVEILGITRVSGENGSNGESSYTHIKYCTVLGGSFVSADKAIYMGVQISSYETPSNDSNDYQWTKIKGDKGDAGSQGIPGTSKFFHIRYSINQDGNPLQTSPAKYIGTLITDYEDVSNVPYDFYTWAKFEGDNGESIKGDDGTSYYLFIRYSNDGGSTFTANNGLVAGSYLGTYISEINTPSLSVSDYQWVKIKGEQGDKGPVPYVKVWNEFDTFRNTNDYVDIVIYEPNGLYYKLKVNASTNQVPPSNTSIWEEIETFKIVATDTLLARDANLANFIFRDSKLVSQHNYIDGTPNLILDGLTGKITANNAVIRGDIEGKIVAESGYISGELKIGKNTGILKLNRQQDFPNVYLGPNQPVFYTGKVKPVYPDYPRDFDRFDAVKVACDYPLEGDRSVYSSYFVIDDLGDLYGRNANFDGFVSADRLDITGRIRQNYKTIIWNTFADKNANNGLLDLFHSSYYLEINIPNFGSGDVGYIYLSEPPIFYSDNTLLSRDAADGTEVNLVIKNNTSDSAELWSAYNSISDRYPIFDERKELISIPANRLTIIKLLYCKHAYKTKPGGDEYVDKLSGWIPVSIFHT